MQEFSPQVDSEVLQNKKKIDACDVFCFVYDSGDANSFAYVANLKVTQNINYFRTNIILITCHVCLLLQKVIAM